VYQQPAASGVQYLSTQAAAMPAVIGGAQVSAAAQPTRITGTLPRVGSNVTAAGRQYYLPQDYDRLSDSGLYIGLSVGYSMSVSGEMHADYVDEPKSWFVPGSFRAEQFKTDTVLPMQISVGAAINSDVRVDFSYARYSGISYPDVVHTSNGMGGYLDVKATGGGISSSATMLNLYYNIDSYTGNIAGGSMRPYVGIGLGISTNTISDYIVYDPGPYPVPEYPDGSPSPLGELTMTSDIYAYHAGGTREQLAYMFEGGVSTELDGGIKLDFFVRYSGLGKVQSSGSIVMSQTEWIGTGVGVIGEAGAEVPAEYDSVFHYTNWRESGNLSSLDVGVRMRLQF
jgi:opacity protein-like surface antigen